jgi:2-polyprenyl-3-methyl-5-hydroxy-6-metoxy-1,4-benzoquinol methylase
MKCRICNFDLKSKLEYTIINIRNPQNNTDIYNYIFCNRCGVGFLENIDSVKVRENYSEDYLEYQNENNKSFFGKFLDYLYYARSKFASDYSLKKDSILDIGCGNGTFLDSVSGVFKNVYGSEYNNYAAKIAKSKIKKLVLLSEDLDDVEEKFDIITMWHVLEHISNPIKFLDQVINLMHGDSVLIIEVPNSNSFKFNFFRENYNWILLPEHLFYYNEKSLRKIFEIKNLEICKIYYPRMFPFMFSNHLKTPILKVISLPISIIIYFLSPLIKSSESIRVVVKKPLK